MNIPEQLKYTATHEWVRMEPDGTITVGITDFAQQTLGDLVFVDMPAPGRKVARAEACAVVESVKAASDLYAPLGGTITATNEDVAKSPERINEDAYAAWLFKLKPDGSADVALLLDAAAYRAEVEGSES